MSNTPAPVETRSKILSAALELFEQDGVEAVSMRTIAARIGVSAMAPYRHFANRQALVHALSLKVVDDLYQVLKHAVQPIEGAANRQREFIRTYFAYWHEHQDRFWLMYQMQNSPREPMESSSVLQPDVHNESYRSAVQLLRSLVADLAHSVDAQPSVQTVNLAGDLCMMMMFGYLTAALVNRRFPWTDRDALKEIAIEQTVQSMIRFLQNPAPLMAQDSA